MRLPSRRSRKWHCKKGINNKKALIGAVNWNWEEDLRYLELYKYKKTPENFHKEVTGVLKSLKII